MTEKRDSFPSEFEEKARDAPAYEPVDMAKPTSSSSANSAFPILAYCGSSILMTVTNKYVLSGLNFNLNFFLLMVQVSPRPPCSRSEAQC